MRTLRSFVWNAQTGQMKSLERDGGNFKYCELLLPPTTEYKEAQVAL